MTIAFTKSHDVYHVEFGSLYKPELEWGLTVRAGTGESSENGESDQKIRTVKTLS